MFSVKHRNHKSYDSFNLSFFSTLNDYNISTKFFKLISENKKKDFIFSTKIKNKIVGDFGLERLTFSAVTFFFL